MGHANDAVCLKCGKEFLVSHGGGFMFHLLRCNKCGEAKDVCFDELGELYLRYLKGLPGPYCVATSEHDAAVKEHADVDPITEEDYHAGVEKFAGKCKCGGKFTFRARPRCPNCKSARLKEGEATLCYD